MREPKNTTKPKTSYKKHQTNPQTTPYSMQIHNNSIPIPIIQGAHQYILYLYNEETPLFQWG